MSFCVFHAAEKSSLVVNSYELIEEERKRH